MIARRPLLLVPLAAAVAGGGAFAVMLHRMKQGRFDPRDVGTPLMDKPAPGFDLPALADSAGIARTDLASGKPVLLNFFASWCQPCILEHPELVRLSGGGLPAGVPLWGIAYKDKPEASRAFLARHGNPFARVATDVNGLTGIEWGITGVPETFLVDGRGTVRWHQPGPLTPEIVADRLMPALRAVA